MADKIKVRLKMTPWTETELSGGEAELTDLKRQGLIYEGNATTDEGAAKAVEKQQTEAAKKTTG